MAHPDEITTRKSAFDAALLRERIAGLKEALDLCRPIFGDDLERAFNAIRARISILEKGTE